MNNYRRKVIDEAIAALSDIIDKIKEVQVMVNDIQSEEQDCLDNIPENLRNSERYEAADTAVRELDDADSALEDAADSAQSAIDALENAKWGGM